jgi:hypothetical protein
MAAAESVLSDAHIDCFKFVVNKAGMRGWAIYRDGMRRFMLGGLSKSELDETLTGIFGDSNSKLSHNPS